QLAASCWFENMKRFPDPADCGEICETTLRRETLRQECHGITQSFVAVAAVGEWRIGNPLPYAFFLDVNSDVIGHVRVCVGVPELELIQLFFDHDEPGANQFPGFGDAGEHAEILKGVIG